MKLVELLAKQIAEWPEGAEHAIQDDDGCFKFGAGKNPKSYGDGIWVRDIEIEHELYNGFNSSEKTSDRESAIVTREQWQAERNKQKGGEWKRHRGGKRPVPDQTQVEVKFRDGDIRQSHASDFFGWKHGELDDIRAEVMQYRVISQPQAEEVEVKDTTIGTLSYKVEIDTSAATQAIDELAAKWDQVDGPPRWRDTVNELDAYIEEFTREREALINRLAEEGFALLPAMHPVMGVADIDFSDWSNWKEGDELRVIDNEQDTHGLDYGAIVTFDGHDTNRRRDAARCDVGNTNRHFWILRENVEFVRRP